MTSSQIPTAMTFPPMPADEESVGYYQVKLEGVHTTVHGTPKKLFKTSTTGRQVLLLEEGAVPSGVSRQHVGLCACCCHARRGAAHGRQRWRVRGVPEAGGGRGGWDKAFHWGNADGGGGSGNFCSEAHAHNARLAVLQAGSAVRHHIKICPRCVMPAAFALPPDCVASPVH